MTQPLCTLCQKPLICHPAQPSHELAWKVCAECSIELERWRILSSTLTHHRKREVSH